MSQTPMALIVISYSAPDSSRCVCLVRPFYFNELAVNPFSLDNNQPQKASFYTVPFAFSPIL